MPVFMFITGYFAKFKVKRLLTYIIGFLVTKSIIVCLDYFVGGQPISLFEFFVNIDWADWYFFVLIFYILIIALLDKIKNTKWLIVIFVLTLILSIITPFFECFSYILSSARFFAFLPFYLAGYIVKRTNFSLNVNKKASIAIKSVNALLVIGSIILVLLTDLFTNRALFGAYSYSTSRCNVWIKLLIIFIAFNYILFFTYTAKVDKKIPLITELGQNTLLVYVMHSVVVLPIGYLDLINFNPVLNYILSIVISLQTVLVFGNKYINIPINKILKSSK